MRKLVYAFVVCLFAISMQAQTQQELLVHLSSGEQVRFNLETQPETTFSGDSIVIITTEARMSYILNDVKYFTYEDFTQGLNELALSDIRIRENNGQLEIEGLADRALVEVYSMDGKVVTSTQAQASQVTVLPLSTCPAGTYIIHAGGLSYKITRQ